MNTRHRSPRSRRGFALIAILWLVVAMAALGLDDSASMRDSLATTQNRMNITRAAWHAEACGEVARAVVDAELADTIGPVALAWERLDGALAAVRWRQHGCTVGARASGDRLDVNTASGNALRAAFAFTGIGVDRADSLANALLDWRDTDSIPRAGGAERAWYSRTRRIGPSNHDFQSDDEIQLVRGFESDDSPAALLGVDPGRIVLSRAPLAVVASLPGMTAEAIARIAELRSLGKPVNDINALSAGLSGDARATLVSAYPELLRLTTSEPDAWMVEISADAGEPAVNVVEELRLVRAGRRAGVTRARFHL